MRSIAYHGSDEILHLTVTVLKDSDDSSNTYSNSDPDERLNGLIFFVLFCCAILILFLLGYMSFCVCRILLLYMIPLSPIFFGQCLVFNTLRGNALALLGGNVFF